MTPSERRPMTSDVPTGAVIVSGASGAVGDAVASRLAEDGYDLVLPERRDTTALAERFPTACVVEADLLDPAATRRVADAAIEGFSGIAGVVNVAGGFAMGSAIELDPDDLERQFDINLRTAVNLTTACLPRLVEQGRGTVIAVSAGPASRGGARMAAYAASKAALEGYVRSVRAEVESEGVGVSLLIPDGTVDTPANREAMPDADPSAWIDPGALGEAAAFLLSRRPRGRVADLRVHV